MEGDDLLLAQMDVKVAPSRDEWMTKLPPERKVSGESRFLFGFLYTLYIAIIVLLV